MKVRSAVLAGAVVVTAVVVGSCTANVDNDSGGKTRHAKVQVHTDKPTNTAPFTSFRDGTFKAGTDIKSGTYKTDGKSHDSLSDYCYWARATDDSGTLGSIIANDFASGPNRVTVRPGETLKTSGGCDWKLVK